MSSNKQAGEGVVSLGTEAWNIADGFTKIKILRLLIQLDLHETIAKFGYNEQEEGQSIYQESIPQKRKEALERMLFTLRQLIGNCRFSIDEKRDKELINTFLKRLENVEDVIDGITTEFFNDVTHETLLVINEKHFNGCFEILRNIKDELNFPLNRANLIFKQSEELDLDRLMSDIIEG